jgi:inosose dehydratase
MDPLSTLQKYAELINHVHYKDWDGRPEFALMGSGEVDFVGITRWLIEQNFTGWIVCEDEAEQAIDDPDGVTLHDGEWIRKTLIPQL